MLAYKNIDNVGFDYFSKLHQDVECNNWFTQLLIDNGINVEPIIVLNNIKVTYTSHQIIEKTKIENMEVITYIDTVKGFMNFSFNSKIFFRSPLNLDDEVACISQVKLNASYLYDEVENTYNDVCKKIENDNFTTDDEKDDLLERAFYSYNNRLDRLGNNLFKVYVIANQDNILQDRLADVDILFNLWLADTYIKRCGFENKRKTYVHSVMLHNSFIDMKRKGAL